jgi:anti-sigma B factor antagonist
VLELLRSEGELDLIRVSHRALDHENALGFRETCSHRIRDGRTLVLDVSEVRFMDSSGIAALLSLQKAAVQAGGALKVAAPGADVRELFEVTRLHRVIDVYNHGDEAFREARPPSRVLPGSGPT